jgi:hypothetical protein
MWTLIFYVCCRTVHSGPFGQLLMKWASHLRRSTDDWRIHWSSSHISWNGYRTSWHVIGEEKDWIFEDVVGNFTFRRTDYCSQRIHWTWILIRLGLFKWSYLGMRHWRCSSKSQSLNSVWKTDADSVMVDEGTDRCEMNGTRSLFQCHVLHQQNCSLISDILQSKGEMSRQEMLSLAAGQCPTSHLTRFNCSHRRASIRWVPHPSHSPNLASSSSCFWNSKGQAWGMLGNDKRRVLPKCRWNCGVNIRRRASSSISELDNDITTSNSHWGKYIWIPKFEISFRYRRQSWSWRS